MPTPAYPWKSLIFVLLSLGPRLSASEVWSAAAFSADPAYLRQAADTVKAEKNSEATVLLNDLHFSFDETGKLVQTHHLIYRIENQQGVEGWAETSGQWEAWHQSRPEIKARVITPDGAVHWLDLKTLNDVPVHEDEPDIYSDERKYGGPLPALAPGVIVEEEVVVRDTAPLFAAGTVDRWRLGWGVPANKTHVVISHPDSLPLHYQLHLLPDATVTKSLTKSSRNSLEIITLEQGPLPAYTQDLENVPADVVMRPEIEFSTGTSWQQVAAGYARLTDEKIRVSDVHALMGKINTKEGSRSDVIRRIVAALHKNVRYTGVEFGESSLIPQFPSETLKRKYGDCKDKATLLVAMLREAGISAHLALLDSGPGRDLNTDLPGMGMFDHAIVYVPASGPDSELWIDATAQYSQVGTLPWMDYGRWALVVGEKTDALKRIPEITSARNVYRETREFTLAEYGMATIVETDDEIGPAEADFRDYYGGDSKEVKEASESYVKNTYLADSLTSLDHGDLADLEKPASIKFVTKGKRGNTDLNTALIAIRVTALFDHLPKYFRTKEDEPATSEDAADKQKPRTADWWITPFTTEWRYKVTAPLGFKLRALPSDKSEKVGTLSFTQKYSANSEGTVVEAVLRVENTNTRMTVPQAKDLRDAVVKAREADAIFITFDNIGHALIAEGKIKEGLAAYQQIAAQHPKEALHKVQLAQALLAAGLGEQARKVALEATTLEPSSALAFSTLGLVLKNDLIGRLVKKGMDYEGAITAYRKAMALDPKDKETRANLALLLEYDPDGTRYSERARLKEAVVELHELKKLDEEYSRSYDDNVLYDLWYAHDYQGVLDYAATLPTSNVRKGLTLAAIALQQGTEAALKKSLEMTTDEQARGQALVTAGAVLVRVRKYAESAALLAEGAHGQSNESQLTRSAAVLGKTKPYEEISIEHADPRSVMQRLFGGMLSGRMTLEEFRPLIYADPQFPDEPMDQKQFQQMMSALKLQLGNGGLPLIVIADMAVSNMHLTVDGDDSLGYKIIIESPGAPAQDAYIVKEGDHYKVAGYSASGPPNLEDLAPLALRALEKNNLAAARKWLDRAREKIHVRGGDDPLAGPPFPYFWTQGQEADVSTMRTAALVLLSSKNVKGPYLAALAQARQAAKTDIERSRLTMVMAYAYAAQERWAEMLPLAQELMKSLPTSVRAFDLAVMAYTGLKRFDDWDKLVQARIQAHPDELDYVRSSARLAAYRGDFNKSREIFKAIIDKGQANEYDLNTYAWYALLLPGPIDQDTIDTAQRANDLSKNSNFAILHTFACVDAQAGRTSQAREMLLKAMDALHLEEPNSEVWFGFGMIAEQYGVLEAAQKMYERVEKPKTYYPGTSYVIAQLRLTALGKMADGSAKTAER
jgi:tetratricopeptide (TPR) repeat protein